MSVEALLAEEEGSGGMNAPVCLDALPRNVRLADILGVPDDLVPRCEQPLHVLGLSTRPLFGLSKNKILTLGALLAMTVDDIYAIHNLGRLSVQEIVDKLSTTFSAFEEQSLTHPPFPVQDIRLPENPEPPRRPWMRLDKLDRRSTLYHICGAHAGVDDRLDADISRLWLSLRAYDILRQMAGRKAASNCPRDTSIRWLSSLTIEQLMSTRYAGRRVVWNILVHLFSYLHAPPEGDTSDAAAAKRSDLQMAIFGRSSRPAPEQVAREFCEEILESPEGDQDVSGVLAMLQSRLMERAQLKKGESHAFIKSCPSLLVLSGRVVWLEGNDVAGWVQSGQLRSFSELVMSTLQNYAGSRNTSVILDRIGADGKTRSYRALSKKYGIAHERIRQIWERAIHHLAVREKAWDSICLPFQAALNNLGGAAGRDEVSGEIERLYADVWGEMPLSLYVSIIWASRNSPNTALEEELVFADEAAQDASKAIAARLEKSFRAGRSLRSDRQVMDTVGRWWKKLRPGPVPSGDTLRICLKQNPNLLCSGTVWALGDRGYSLGRSSGDRVRSVLLSAGQPMHYREIAKAYRELFGPIDETGVRKTLRQHGRKFVLTGPGIYGLEELGAVKMRWVVDIMEDFLAKKGGPASEQEMEEAVLAERQASRASIHMELCYKNNNARFQRYGDKWGLKRWSTTSEPSHSVGTRNAATDDSTLHT